MPALIVLEGCPSVSFGNNSGYPVIGGSPNRTSSTPAENVQPRHGRPTRNAAADDVMVVDAGRASRMSCRAGGGTHLTFEPKHRPPVALNRSSGPAPAGVDCINNFCPTVDAVIPTASM